MSAPTLTELADRAFDIYRGMLLKQETYMLSKGYVHTEEFVRGSFKNLRDGAETLHKAMRDMLDILRPRQ